MKLDQFQPIGWRPTTAVYIASTIRNERDVDPELFDLNHDGVFMIMRSLLLFSMVVVAGAASAGQAELCYSTPVAYASATPPNNTTVFVCPLTGSKTLPELASLGWQAVQLTPVTSGSGGGAGSTHITQQLLIQK